ncbi:YdbH domain-containing protein [Shewanella nanhaiensis]|uniref:YdbH domain-containing protein n=1 Tax=Shewanella nanhaiensis TaxID=2864872 RepID=A0ABS7E2B6_9GAMM|nr:YdbH domain-containing protein [Shewanella nanhaiensis]MBW8183782.1 YdbH domain-containing protein [Shewanella nanhaiensis]
MLAFTLLFICLFTALLMSYEWLTAKFANQYLANYDTQITKLSIRPRSLTQWHFANVFLEVKDSDIKIKDLELTLAPTFSLLNFSTDQIAKISLGQVDVALNPDILTDEGKNVDQQGPTVALDIAQLPQVEIGPTRLTLKNGTTNPLNLVLAHLTLDNQGSLSSLLTQEGETLLSMDAQLSDTRWAFSTSVVFEQVQTLLNNIAKQPLNNKALTHLILIKQRVDELGLQLSGTLNSQAELNLKTAQLRSNHELIDTNLKLTQLADLVITPEASLTPTNNEPNHTAKFTINGHIADLSLSLQPFSIAVAPEYLQQVALRSLIKNKSLHEMIELLHPDNKATSFNPLSMKFELNEPLNYSFAEQKLLSPKIQLAIENEMLSAKAQLQTLNLTLESETQGAELEMTWSLNTVTKKRLELTTILPEQLSSYALELAKTTSELKGKVKAKSNKVSTELSLNLDKATLFHSEELMLHEPMSQEQSNREDAMVMSVKSLSLQTHSPLNLNNSNDTFSIELPSLTLALGPVSYDHKQPSSKTKEVSFSANSLSLHTDTPSYLSATKHPTGNEPEVLAIKFNGSIFSLNSEGINFLDKKMSKTEGLAPPSISVSTQEANLQSLDRIKLEKSQLDDGTTQLALEIPRVKLQQLANELVQTGPQVAQAQSKNTATASLNQEVNIQLPSIALTLMETANLKLAIDKHTNLNQLLKQQSLQNQAKYQIEGLEIKRSYHKNRRLRIEKLLELSQGELIQSFNWNKQDLNTQEHWLFDGLNLDSTHTVTPDLTQTNLTDFTVEGKAILDTDISSVLSVINANYSLPPSLNLNGHTRLDLNYLFTQERKAAQNSDVHLSKSRFSLDFTPRLSELRGSINELPFEGAMMDASCHLELNRTGKDQSIDPPKEQSTLSCPDINLSAVAFNPGVLIEDFKANANISISKDSEKLESQSASVPANLTNANIQMNAGGKLLGGELLLPEFDLNLNAPSHGYLVLQGLSLAQLIEIQPQVGLYADGIFDGVLPVDLLDGKVSVTGGRLAARAPGGLITLSGNPAVDQMRTSQPYLDFAFSTLEHLEYSELASTFDMEPSGDAILNVNVKGHTKGIERPIHLNYSQEENMLLLLKSLQIGDKLQTQIEQSMN